MSYKVSLWRFSRSLIAEFVFILQPPRDTRSAGRNLDFVHDEDEDDEEIISSPLYSVSSVWLLCSEVTQTRSKTLLLRKRRSSKTNQKVD